MEKINKLIEQGVLLRVPNGDLLTDLIPPESVIGQTVIDERYRFIFEFFVHDINSDELLEQTTINVLSEWNKSIFIDSDRLLINPGIHLRNLGYSSGNYRIKYKFFKTIVGSPNSEKLSIKRISPSRTEIEIIPPEGLNDIVSQLVRERIDLYSLNPIQRDYVNFLQRKTKNNVSKLTTYLNFGFDKTFLIINSKPMNDIDMLLKLYQPLTVDIQEFDTCYICEEVLQPYEDRVVLYTEKLQDTSNLIYLRKPDVDYNSAGIHYRTTPLENFETLVTSDREIKNEIMRYYLSSSIIEGINLNVDYRLFENFAKFGSIEKRLINFRQKVRNIEFYSSKINQFYSGSIGSASLSTPEISSSIDYFRTLKQNTINEFDNYERFLYYESSSYESSSIGEFYESTWPKYTSTKPYLLYSYTSSQAQQWYLGIIESASIYDNMNKDLYSNFVPLDMQLDDQNKDFVKFINMIGHYLDIINVYIKEMPSWHYKDNSIDEGIPKDLIIHAINHYGFDLRSGQVLKSLNDYIIATSSDWSFTPDFEPTDISGLTVWLDSSDYNNMVLSASRISQINDKSGNGNHFVQTVAEKRPIYEYGTLNGLNTTFFSESLSSSLTCQTLPLTIVSGSKKSITVIELHNIDTQSNFFYRNVLSTEAIGNFIDLGNYSVGYSLQLMSRFVTSSNFIQLSIVPPLDSWHIYMYELQYNGISNITLTGSKFETGSQISLAGSGNFVFTGSVYNVGSQMTLGARSIGDNWNTKRTAEVLLYYRDEPLTEIDKDNIVEYLYNKWKYY